jgi:hypothetical protein
MIEPIKRSPAPSPAPLRFDVIRGGSESVRARELIRLRADAKHLLRRIEELRALRDAAPPDSEKAAGYTIDLDRCYADHGRVSALIRMIQGARD